MPARRVKCLLASLIAVGAIALLPSVASAHPEACADASLASMPTAVTFDQWADAYEGCLSKAAQNNFDDSAAQLAPGETAGTKNLKLVAHMDKQAPFDSS